MRLRELPRWWLSRLHSAAAHSLRLWRREPEWPLLVGSIVLFASFLIHYVGYRLALHQIPSPLTGAPIFQPARWEGRVGWRKPLVFGISNAMVFCSLREALRSQGLLPRGDIGAPGFLGHPG
ncbi:unnamed protein product [Symbiodinium natans]|uniref:Uncharacterized protein n=1 Tax=Symbiodinium natans TaxID=878477 RepID=A0A812RTW8_9DINO|nr:unnamed protein product [Symbiodinium natans]